jgi:hypothetical protein
MQGWAGQGDGLHLMMNDELEALPPPNPCLAQPRPSKGLLMDLARGAGKSPKEEVRWSPELPESESFRGGPCMSEVTGDD